MENDNKTAKRLERTAVKEGNHTHAADDIDWWDSKINCRFLWQFMNHYPEIQNCYQDAVGSQIGHLVEIYSLCSVEILSLTWSVNNDGRELL